MYGLYLNPYPIFVFVLSANYCYSLRKSNIYFCSLLKLAILPVFSGKIDVGGVGWYLFDYLLFGILYNVHVYIYNMPFYFYVFVVVSGCKIEK